MRVSWSEYYERHPLLRHFVHEPLFLLALGGVALVAVAVPLGLAKIWHPAPAHFSKRVSVSLLDYGQAWALRRSALKARTEGRWDDALVAARGALGNNISDSRSLRVALELLRDGPSVRSANLPLMLLVGNLLLEVERTNRPSCALVADVYERFRLPEYALRLLQPWQEEFGPGERRTWLRSLVSAGRVGMFTSAWKTNQAAYAGDRVMEVYAAGADALAGGEIERVVRGMTALRAALEVPEVQLAAARMLGAAAYQRNDLTDYQRAIGVLQQLNSAMVFDDVLLWQLLARNGQLAEARERASKYPNVPPPTAVEAVQLARAWLALGLDELGVSMFRDNASRYGLDVDVWSTYLDLLTMRRDWKEVRSVASLLRVNASTRDDLLPIALYADVRADIADGRRTSARDFLSRLKDSKIRDPRLAFRMASGLNAAGEGDVAMELLRRLESELEHLPEYWVEVLGAAQKRRNVEEMRRASDQLVSLAPENPTVQMIRLVVLLGGRSEPGEALSTSLRLLGRGIQSPAMKINHAMALLLNDRVEEAAKLLAEVPVLDLNPADLNSWQIAQAEALARLGRHREALETGKHADPSLLLPPQEEWFRRTMEDSRKKFGTGGVRG